MPRDLVSARFPRLDEGYESWFLRAADPSGGKGFWIRYTVHRKPDHAPTGSLWFTYFDAQAPAPVATKLTVDGPEAADWVRIGDATLQPGVAQGSVEVPEALPVGWDLTFAGTSEAFAHLPRGWMYDAPLPRTKPVSVHPSARFDGRLVVGERVVSVDGWRGTLGHNWGSEHAERWIWLHATGFEDTEDAWLDVVLARLRLGRWTTPWSGFGGFSVDGSLLRLGGLGRVRGTRVDEHASRLSFTMPGGGVRVDGRVSARPELFVGWEYADPDGSAHDVVHCSIADLSMTVRRDGFDDRALEARGVAAYELGMREHDHGIAIQPFADG